MGLNVKQLLLIEPESSLSKVTKLNLMKAYDLNVIERETAQEAVDLLELLPDISLVILNDSSQAHLLFEFILKANPELPVLLKGEAPSTVSKLTRIAKDESWPSIVEWTGKILSMKPMQSYEQSRSEYVGVPISYFLNINETSMGCDVYIKVKKGDEFQYLKRLNSTDFFERADIEKYITAGLQEFHIKKEHFESFVNFVTDQLILQMSDKTVSSKERVRLGSEVYEITADRIYSLGIDERTIEIVSESINAMQTSLGKGNALSDFLNLMMQNKLSYGYAHSYLNCLLLNKIVKNFDWNSHLIRDKIAFMSYFHDISLKISESEKFHNLDGLSKEDSALFQDHARRSAEIVEKFPQVPMGIGPLIREHHGMKSGVGFSDNLNNTISPISMAFIVVEDFAGEFMKIEGAPTLAQLEKILARLSDFYNKGAYAQTVQALQSSIVKKA